MNEHLSTIGKVHVRDVDALCAWIDRNKIIYNGNGSWSSAFFEAAESDIANLVRLDDANKIIYVPGCMGQFFVDDHVASVQSALRFAAQEEQPLELFAVSGAACLAGYGREKFILPVSEVELVLLRDHTTMTSAEMQSLTGSIMPVADNALSISAGDSIATVHQEQDLYAAQKEAIEHEKQDVRDAVSGDLRTMREEIERMQMELRKKQDALMAEIAEREAALKAKMDGLKKQLFVLETQVYGIRCYLGETIDFTAIMTGEPAKADSPVVIYQKVRYLDEELGRHLSIYSWRFDADGLQDSFVHVLRTREDILDLFLPSEKCIACVAISRTGTIVKNAVDGRLQNFLRAYEMYHGRQVAILVRNGGNVYIGWTDAEKVMLDSDNVFLTPGSKEVAAEDAAAMKNTSIGARLSRYYILQFLQGLLDDGRLLSIPAKEKLFSVASKYVIFSAASGLVEDARYGSFEEILKKSADIPLKGPSGTTPGDPIVSMLWIVGSDESYNNERGLGVRNRTHDAKVEPLTVMTVNKIVPDLHLEVRVNEYEVAWVPSSGKSPLPFRYRGTSAKWMDAVQGRKLRTLTDICDIDYKHVYDLTVSYGGPSQWTEEQLVKAADRHYAKSCTNSWSEKPSLSKCVFKYYDEDQRIIALEARTQVLTDEEAACRYTIREIVSARIARKSPHYYVSVPMGAKRWSWTDGDETDATAHMELQDGEWISPAYLCSTWLDWVVLTKRVGNLTFGGATFDYPQLLPTLNVLREYVRRREEIERSLLEDIGLLQWLNDTADWDVKLCEWRIANRVRLLTPSSAKRFASHLRKTGERKAGRG